MSDSAQERTEQATLKRLEEAAEKGQIAYSKELGAAMLLLLVLALMKNGGTAAISALQHLFERTFHLANHAEVTPAGIGEVLADPLSTLVMILMPMLMAVFGASLAAGFLQAGFKLSLQRIEPNLERINPMSGFGKLMSSRSLMSVALSLAKCALLVAICWSTLDTILDDARSAGQGGFAVQAQFVALTALDLGMRVAGFLLLVAVVDFFWQRFRHAKDLMMTREEVKEENKQTEGDPKIKARIRQVQRTVARQRMLEDVKKATVVVRNPTHFAVALRYESGKDSAPRVVAKGMDFMALKIIATAEKAGVPVKSEPPLARQLWRSVKVGRTVPEELFRAVAKVLAWVYRSRGARRSASGVNA
jgi:flagellar biosynthetic protein FlhB